MADTCCSAEPGDVYFCFLNRAFINDPEIDEVDIIPCLQCHEEQEKEEQDPTIVIHHKLGIKSWCIKHLYLFAYKKLLHNQKQEGKKDYSLTVTDSLQLTRAVLIFNAECYTAWNIRKELMSTGVLSVADDMKFSSLIISKYPRSAETFAHRRWTIAQLVRHKGESFFMQSCLRTELVTTLHAAEKYADNYTAWSHRAWLVERFMSARKKKLLCELQMMRKWTEMHISDNCGFHYRQILIKLLQNICSRSEVMQLSLEELEFTRDLIMTFPGHEVVWYHRRFLYHFWNQWFADVSTENLLEITSSTDGEKARNNSLTDVITTDSRKASRSRIPSLSELANSSYELLKKLNSSSTFLNLGSDSLAIGMEKDKPSPLSTPSELEFCDRVIAECKGSEGEVQRRCVTNYQKWILLSSSKACLLDHGATTEMQRNSSS